MIRLHDFELSGSCYGIRLLLNMLSVPYEKVNVDLVNQQQESPTYLDLNPFGEQPILEDGSLRLRNAEAILTYVARKYDKFGTWYPADADGAARIHQWLATASGDLMHLARATSVKVFHLPANLGHLFALSHCVLKILDGHLENRKWLELGRPTIADVACFPHVALSEEAGVFDLKEYRNVSEWVERFKTVPGFVRMYGVSSVS
ncbi:glutathione S-transferase family protein [Cupriavidus taiwanensis]|uniref:Glutathione S-transferase n=1 Tax=Cupriavidus taiwanensis TaxID=164546 RepID=A0A7Z7NQ35_9BURK|nr:glutathione S-transferase N-terminal domain-containing protein [Cupriavidus taiwanensis]SOZ17150.1 Glutathione S-transferase [Cupriavidus taiwanensis]SOZ96185.1 Glutathione S-transferase [Cupriavidus taiwanensis]SPC25532.1 Glutathione S-transferase [Cupriavidus taiwanensis]